MKREATEGSPMSGKFGPRSGEFCWLRRGRAYHTMPVTGVSEQVNVTVVSGHTVTCPFSDSTDEERTIPSVPG